MTEARHYAQRGAAKQRGMNRWWIDGEHVSSEQIATRLVVDRTTALGRLRREQRKQGKVTWQGLSE